MHCRMPNNANFQTLPDPQKLVAPFPQMIFQKPPSDQEPNPLPFPIPPGMPPLPGMAPIPGLPPAPGMPPIPGLPGPFPIPMPGAGPAHKLPVIVMPFYSPDPSFKKTRIQKRKHRKILPIDESSDTDTSLDSSTDSSTEDGWWRGSRGFRRSNTEPNRGLNRRPNRRSNHRHKPRHHHNKKDLLTPVLQYVTKDGYVIFEKEISKNEAKDWLSMRKETRIDDNNEQIPESPDLPNNNFEMAEPDVMSDVEILDIEKNKIKTQAEDQSPKVVVRKHHPHKIKSHRPKEEKGEIAA